MKRIFTILAALLLTISLFAQTPQKMSYQAVVRDASNHLVINQAVGMQISILQNTTPVYVETHTITTNANGLATLEIGTGTLVSGDINTINWADGLYFIKTETDPEGGTAYNIAGTSQLLSVPYALHAKTAETISETDPIYTNSQAANIDATDITNLSNLSGTNTGDQDLSALATKTELRDSTAKIRSQIPPPPDGSETKLTAGNNVVITGNGTTEKPYVINAGVSNLTIGQAYQGGKIFWLDATGQHGLIAAISDQSTGIQWSNGNNSVTNAVRDGIGAGKFNTERIIANQGSTAYAAQICANYQGGNYGDWYLPSKYELNLLYLQKNVIGGFADEYYWCSNEGSSTNAWSQYFLNDNQFFNFKTKANYVRAIRAF